MDPALLHSLLTREDKAFYQDIRIYEEVDSTNNLLKRRALEGAPEGAVVLSRRQTAGKGRLGRRFVSPPGGVYLSVLLRPPLPAGDSAPVTACAAVCVAEAAGAACGCAATIKWVNDVLLGGKKFCGILTESVAAGASDSAFLVVGIGLNINTDTASFPPEAAAAATSLARETGRAQSCERVSAALLTRLSAFYAGFPDNTPDYVRRYRERLATLGQTVVITGDENRIPYEALDIDSRFGLVVRSPGGRETTLRSGEVSVRPDVPARG